jgi:hypothetical protein
MTEDSDNYLYSTSEKMMKEYKEAYHALADNEDPKDYVVKWQEAKKDKQPMKKQVKRKLAAPMPKKGAKKKTTYLYGGPAK